MVLHSRGCGRVARRRIQRWGFPSSVTLREPPFLVFWFVFPATLREPLFLFPHTGVSSAHWRFSDAGRTAGGMIPPPTGCFVPPEGPWADRSSHWESRDAGGSQEFQGSFLPLSDGGIDWGTMHYFVPKRCVESNKIMYRDKATARQAADQSWRERGTELWVYRCEFCGTWHLTHRDPQSSYTYVPLNQQIKPHSRKKGYKPRRK